MYKNSFPSHPQVSNWLIAGMAMILVRILLGGVTRLTGSGLSITEWQPLLGALPPLSQGDWEHSFAQYRQIAQFKKLNNQFSLSDYQAIFCWEWLHREWARLMGLVFVIPFFIFLWQGKFKCGLAWPLTGLFLLGALQGLAGWLMVKSGLNATEVSVDAVRLAIHFSLALILLVYLLRLYVGLAANQRPDYVPAGLRNYTFVILLLLGLQLFFGALMAGSHAATYAPTWPDINGSFFIFSPGVSGKWFYRIIRDPLLIQFTHRSLAYLLLLLFIIWWFRAQDLPVYTRIRKLRHQPLYLLLIQVGLGIATLHFCGTAAYRWLAIFHQLNAILLLLSFANLYFRSSRHVI